MRNDLQAFASSVREAGEKAEKACLAYEAVCKKFGDDPIDAFGEAELVSAFMEKEISTREANTLSRLLALAIQQEAE